MQLILQSQMHCQKRLGPTIQSNQIFIRFTLNNPRQPHTLLYVIVDLSDRLTIPIDGEWDIVVNAEKENPLPVWEIYNGEKITVPLVLFE